MCSALLLQSWSNLSTPPHSVEMLGRCGEGGGSPREGREQEKRRLCSRKGHTPPQRGAGPAGSKRERTNRLLRGSAQQPVTGAAATGLVTPPGCPRPSPHPAQPLRRSRQSRTCQQNQTSDPRRFTGIRGDPAPTHQNHEHGSVYIKDTLTMTQT